MDIYAFCVFLIDADGVRYAASRLSSDIIMAIRGRNSGYKQLSIWNPFNASAVNLHNICHYMEKDVAKLNSRFYFLLLIFSLKNVHHFLAFILGFWSLLEASSLTQLFVRRKCSWKIPSMTPLYLDVLQSWFHHPLKYPLTSTPSQFKENAISASSWQSTCGAGPIQKRRQLKRIESLVG